MRLGRGEIAGEVIAMDRNEGIAARSFRGASGDTEHVLCIEAPPGLGFARQIDAVAERYEAACRALRLAPESAIFRRLFVSDVMNQAPALRDSRLFAAPQEGPVAVSIVQQKPLPEAKLALFAYHLDSAGPVAKRQLSPKHLLVEKNGFAHLWSTRLCAGADGDADSPAAQTRAVFDELIGTLARQGGSLRDHCVRTWIYLKDVDVFYQGMVEGRNALFREQGLTGDTHYIASTGIEGACAHRYDLVAMDAYSILGLAPRQVTYLNDFDRLCATKDYNVTFERGTRVAYADRAHHFISGTASIDNRGRVLYPGNVLRQLERALDNVEGLLRAGNAGLDDMMHLTVYLRDPTDFAVVERALAERLPGLPALFVQGAVCRPEWLVEVEGVAATAQSEPALPRF
jgi:enamine deaminase RidA (YjgF/YER057c/UK114 family)